MSEVLRVVECDAMEYVGPDGVLHCTLDSGHDGLHDDGYDVLWMKKPEYE